jgi:hypothetical protein
MWSRTPVPLGIDSPQRPHAGLCATDPWGDPDGRQRVYRWPCGIPHGCCRLELEHNPCSDSAGFDVGDRLVYLVERSRFADHARPAGVVQLEHLA